MSIYEQETGNKLTPMRRFNNRLPEEQRLDYGRWMRARI